MDGAAGLSLAFVISSLGYHSRSARRDMRELCQLTFPVSRLVNKHLAGVNQYLSHCGTELTVGDSGVACRQAPKENVVGWVGCDKYIFGAAIALQPTSSDIDPGAWVSPD